VWRDSNEEGIEQARTRRNYKGEESGVEEKSVEPDNLACAGSRNVGRVLMRYDGHLMRYGGQLICCCKNMVS